MSPDLSPDEIAAHLRACEETLLDPAARKDRAKVAALLADDFCEFGSSGRIWTRDEILDLLATEDYAPPTIEDFASCVLADGVVLVTYRAVRASAGGEGATITLRTSIWMFRNSAWRVRFHQGTKSS